MTSRQFSVRRAGTSVSTLSRWALLAALALILPVPTPAAGAPPIVVPPGPRSPYLVEEAAIAYDAPSTDPCIGTRLLVDVQDPLKPNADDTLFVELSTTNTCSGEYRQIAPLTGSVPVDETAFHWSNGHDVADLVVTVPAFDTASQTETSISVDLRWDSVRGASDPDAVATGMVTASDLGVVLDDSIAWNSWGSEEGFPWAGLWPCRFIGSNVNPGSQGPGCIGQRS